MTWVFAHPCLYCLPLLLSYHRVKHYFRKKWFSSYSKLYISLNSLPKSGFSISGPNLTRGYFFWDTYFSKRTMSGSQRDSDGTLIERIPPCSSGSQRNLWSVHSCIRRAYCNFMLKGQCIRLGIFTFMFIYWSRVFFKKGNPCILDLMTLPVAHHTSQDAGWASPASELAQAHTAILPGISKIAIYLPPSEESQQQTPLICDLFFSAYFLLRSKRKAMIDLTQFILEQLVQ